MKSELIAGRRRVSHVVWQIRNKKTYALDVDAELATVHGKDLALTALEEATHLRQVQVHET